MSVQIICKNIVKKYGNTTIIPGLDLTVEKSEFFTLLGPSGCGKTTLLRMIAGFNTIEGGTISFDDKVINRIPPNKRNIGMVFQNYAIFPHMSVKKNVAYGLKNRKVPSAEIEKKVDYVLEKVRISQLKDRMPENMSGGQQQRIALARAIVIEPDVLLMDEPLSNLDAKLRIEMRDTIRELQKSVGITTIYVTHDQEEAMAVSDRIAVMKDGVIQQIGTPRDIYHRPSNVFVASFIGSTNILDGVLRRTGGEAWLEIGSYKMKMTNIVGLDGEANAVKVSIRPEDFSLCSENEECISGKVVANTFLGTDTHYVIELETGERVKIVLQSQESDSLSSGDTVHLRVAGERINVYSEDGAANCTKRIGV